MDKSTLSNYGWIVIVTLVLSVMLAFATPFGGFVARGVSNVIKYYKTATGDVFSAYFLKGKQGEWDDYLNDVLQPDNDHIFAIGKTKPEYVLAVFNEDFTHVNIVKNGTNSDGLMKDFRTRDSFIKPDLTNDEIDVAWKPHASPMQLNAKTLKSATVEKGVVSLGVYAFYKCDNLQNITFAKTVKKIDTHCFMYCKKLPSIIIPEKVKKISNYCFYGCNKLIEIKIPETLTTIGSCAFFGCNALSNFDFPKECKEIQTAAFGCANLKSVTLPKGFLKLGSHAFESNHELKTISIPASTTVIEEAILKRTKSLKSIIIDSDNPNYTVIDGVLYNADKTLLLACISNKEGTYSLLPTVEKIGDGAFSQSRLKTVFANDNLKEIHNDAFEYSQIESFNIPLNVKTIGDTVFFEVKNLKTITVDSNNTNFKIIDDGLYSFDEKTFYCLPAANTQTTFTMLPSVTTIVPGAFACATNLQEITIPEGVTTIPSYCFYQTTSKINLPTNFKAIGYGAFGHISNLTSITIPESVKSINEDAFVNTPLTTIYGKSGSSAETFANIKKITFVAI